ncbi:MAG: bifunctional RNase H/acid phosphatase [Rhodoluna sp.]|nr:bifunctional RNase H/acid phosphatase [Rhodoluna sp.]
MARSLIIEADGGSRGNPGTAGSGAVVIDQTTGMVIREIARFIGIASNNVAEYIALIAGLEAALDIDSNADIEVRMDSKLVIEQMSGRWKIKHPDMIQLGMQVQDLVRGKKVSWQWIPREQNFRADALANKAMDELSDSESSGLVISTAANNRLSSSVTEFNESGPSSVRSPIDVTKPLTTIVLVRHGRTALTEARKISGGDGDDPDLSEVGVLDANAVATALGQIGSKGPWQRIAPISAIVSSPMKRARQTAEVIAKQHGLKVTENENLREISFGDWDGLTHEEAQQKDSTLWQSWRGSWSVSPPNGESLEVFDQRLQLARQQIAERHAGKTVVVVAHVMPIRGFLRWAFDAAAAAYWRPQVAPCSISIIRVWGDETAEVVTVNHTAHL